MFIHRSYFPSSATMMTTYKRDLVKHGIIWHSKHSDWSAIENKVCIKLHVLNTFTVCITVRRSQGLLSTTQTQPHSPLDRQTTTELWDQRCHNNPLKPNSSSYYTLPYRPNLPFFISDIRALWRSALSASARMSKIINGRFGLYGAEHSKCNRMMTPDWRPQTDMGLMHPWVGLGFLGWAAK